MVDIRAFLKWEAAGGVLLVIASVLALVIANSPLAEYYQQFWDLKLTVTIEDWGVAKPLLLWVNDGLMAVFFLMVGLELKREWLQGELSTMEQRWLPAFAALGGMVVPAAVYAFFNWHDAARLEGWAIPAATDIAFALGVLSLLGNKIPLSLKVFLVSLAIIDDIGAIIIIAFFYTSQLSPLSLMVASASLVILFLMNRRGVMNVAAYLAVGLILWVSVLKSGVHATLAGIALAMFIPMQSKDADENVSKEKDENKKLHDCPAKELEHDLHSVVAFIILPVFAFANAGVSLDGLNGSTPFDPIMIGVMAGLLIGKPVGIVAGALAARFLVGASLPAGVSWRQLIGAAFLCGIGFTMSLFVTTLAFEQNLHLAIYARIGIIAGSIIAALIGYALLYKAPAVAQEESA